jgi:hypothetical protein
VADTIIQTQQNVSAVDAECEVIFCDSESKNDCEEFFFKMPVLSPIIPASTTFPTTNGNS